jgi:hypothetical protein
MVTTLRYGQSATNLPVGGKRPAVGEAVVEAESHLVGAADVREKNKQYIFNVKQCSFKAGVASPSLVELVRRAHTFIKFHNKLPFAFQNFIDEDSKQVVRDFWASTGRAGPYASREWLVALGEIIDEWGPELEHSLAKVPPYELEVDEKTEVKESTVAMALRSLFRNLCDACLSSNLASRSKETSLATV